MLMTPITPKVMARPIAASSSTEPSERPYQTFCSALQSASRARSTAIASLRGACAPPARCRPAGRASSAERILVAALAHGRDGRELVRLGGVGEVEDDRRARLDQGAS